jgi:hypothetical protein
LCCCCCCCCCLAPPGWPLLFCCTPSCSADAAGASATAAGAAAASSTGAARSWKTLRPPSGREPPLPLLLRRLLVLLKPLWRPTDRWCACRSSAAAAGSACALAARGADDLHAAAGAWWRSRCAPECRTSRASMLLLLLLTLGVGTVPASHTCWCRCCWWAAGAGPSELRIVVAEGARGRAGEGGGHSAAHASWLQLPASARRGARVFVVGGVERVVCSTHHLQQPRLAVVLWRSWSHAMVVDPAAGTQCGGNDKVCGLTPSAQSV